MREMREMREIVLLRSAVIKIKPKIPGLGWGPRQRCDRREGVDLDLPPEAQSQIYSAKNREIGSKEVQLPSPSPAPLIPTFCSPLPYPSPTRNGLGLRGEPPINRGNNLPTFFWLCPPLCSEFGPALQVPQYTPQSPPKTPRCMCAGL